MSHRPTRRHAAAAITAVAALTLTACAGPSVAGADGAGTAGDEATAEAVDWSAVEPASEITWWSNHPGQSQAVEQELIDAFEAENPEISVNLVTAGANYDEVAQRFQAASQTDDLPDLVIASDVWWFRYHLNDQIMPLDDVLEHLDADAEDFQPALYADYEYEDQHWAVPYARSTPLFYYNKDLWKAAGLEDRGPKTWQELQEWAPKLKAAAGADKSVFEMPDGSNYLDWYFQNMVWDFGGNYSKEWTPTFTDPKTVAAGQFLQDFAKAGYVKFNKTPEADFGAGLATCIVQSTGSLGGITKAAKFSVGTAFLPGDGNCPTGGAGVGIPANISDDRKKNALKFIEFLTNAQNTVTFTQATGYMPVRKSAVELPEEKAYLEKNPNAKTAIEQLPKTRSQDYVRVLLPGGGARIGKGLDQIVQGQDVATVFKALDAESQQVFDSQIKSKLGA